jgi:hypothetical protein
MGVDGMKAITVGDGVGVGVDAGSELGPERGAEIETGAGGRAVLFGQKI